MGGEVSSPFHDADLLLRQPIQFNHQPVDLPVGGVDLRLQQRLLRRRAHSNAALVQVQHAFDQGDDF